MYFQRLALAAVIVLTPGLAPAAEHSEDKSMSEDVEKTPTAYSGTKASAEGFLVETARTNIEVAELARLAKDRSPSASIVKAVDEIVTAHMTLNNELKKIFADQQIAFPTDAPAEGTENFAKLSRVPAEEFDEKFLSILQNQHEEMLLGIKKQLTETRDPQYKRWLQSAEQVIEQHQSALKSLKKDAMKQPAMQ